MTSHYCWTPEQLLDMSNKDLLHTIELYNGYEGDSVGTGSFDHYHRLLRELKAEMHKRHNAGTWRYEP